MRTSVFACVGLAAALMSACANKPPQPSWQGIAKASVDRSIAAYLAGNQRVDDAELARARSEVASTGRADLLARVELSHCAAQVASLVFGPCERFEALRADSGASERAYADYLMARFSSPNASSRDSAFPTASTSPTTSTSTSTSTPTPTPTPTPTATATATPTKAALSGAASDIALLPEHHRALAAPSMNDASIEAALAAIADPLSRLVAAGVLLEAGRADRQVIGIAVDTASAQGWRRPLLAWLGVQLKLAEKAAVTDEVQRLQRRIALVQSQPV